MGTLIVLSLDHHCRFSLTVFVLFVPINPIDEIAFPSDITSASGSTLDNILLYLCGIGCNAVGIDIVYLFLLH